MGELQLLELVRQSLVTGGLALLPVLAAGFAVALVAGFMQAATGIHEPVVGLVPRLIAMGVVLLVTMSWMVEQLAELFRLAATGAS